MIEILTFVFVSVLISACTTTRSHDLGAGLQSNEASRLPAQAQNASGMMSCYGGITYVTPVPPEFHNLVRKPIEFTYVDSQPTGKQTEEYIFQTVRVGYMNSYALAFSMKSYLNDNADAFEKQLPLKRVSYRFIGCKVDQLSTY